MEEVGLLRDDADKIRERAERQVAHVDVADRNATPPDVVETRGEVTKRRLAGTGLAHERRCCARAYRERDVLERPLVTISEPHVVEEHVARSADGDRIGLLLDVDRLVEVLEDPVEESE